MKFLETPIDGLVLIAPDVFRDSRGGFYESYNAARFRDAGIDAAFVQDNVSISARGVIRGLHAQTGPHAQAKLVRVLRGRALDVCVDIRDGSPTFGQHFSVELSGENNLALFVPRGFLHGFSVLEDNTVFAYKCDNLYRKDAECGVRYDDAALGIDWGIPAGSVRVSEKDLNLKGFEHVAAYRR